MKRGRPPITDPAKVRAWQDRTRRAQALEPDERAVREAVLARDGHRCALRDLDPAHRCAGPLTFHHRRKAGAQGAYTEANGLTLCAGGNGWVEDNPDAAQALAGTVLVVRPGDAEWDALGKRAARG